MVDQKEEMDDRLVAIKGDIRKAQLQVNRLEYENMDVVQVGIDIREYLMLAQVYAEGVPPIERMIAETVEVWLTLLDGGQTDPKGDGLWLTGATFAIIAAIDFMLEVDTHEIN